MSLHLFVLEALRAAAAAHAWWLPLAVIFWTVILEDTATIVVGLLVANHVLPPGLVAASLACGIAIGDSISFGIGRLARVFPALERFAKSPRLAGLEGWLAEHIFSSVFVTRFLPGLRLTIYVTYGFLGIPFRKFFPPALLAALSWTALLFGLFYAFGRLAFGWYGLIRWPLIIIALGVFYLGGHLHFKRIVRSARGEEPPRS